MSGKRAAISAVWYYLLDRINYIVESMAFIYREGDIDH
jgi:hypothetical protein